MAFLLQGRNALVTGSSRGIGRAIAERRAADGAAVVVNYTHSPQQAREVVDGIKARDGKASAIQADVSKPAEVRRLFDETERCHSLMLRFTLEAKRPWSNSSDHSRAK